jgi:phosphatidylethanolamine/phosphatidyl-N-methylethanolamine N-methyltransferase
VQTIHRSWDWLSSDPHALFVVVLALALLTAVAAAMRWSRSFNGRNLMMQPLHDRQAEECLLPARSSRVERNLRGKRRPHLLIKRRFSVLRRRIRRSRTLRDNLLFLSRLASAPRQMGAVAPSGRRLGRAMAAELPDDHQVCVELGGGTGSLTRALLSAGLPRENLIVIERDPRLAAHLRKRFRGVRVIRGEAQELTTLLRAEGIGAVDAIVSGLPLRSLPRHVGSAIAAESFAALREGGVFIQFTYLLLPPVPPMEAAKLSIEGAAMSRVWRNLPPATVWRYRRAGAGG